MKGHENYTTKNTVLYTAKSEDELLFYRKSSVMIVQTNMLYKFIWLNARKWKVKDNNAYIAIFHINSAWGLFHLASYGGGAWNKKILHLPPPTSIFFLKIFLQ